MTTPDPAELSHWLALASCVVLTTTGHLCLKVGTRRARGALASFVHPWTLLGWFLFVLNTMAGVYALQAIDLKVGSTWSAAAYPLIALLARALLDEPLTRRQLAGCTLIAAGIFIFYWPF